MPELIEYSRAFLDAVDYNGVCGLDFRYDNESGRIGFIEMNARFTGGLATPIAAGFDIPYMLYSLSTNNETDIEGGENTCPCGRLYGHYRFYGEQGLLSFLRCLNIPGR